MKLTDLNKYELQIIIQNLTDDLHQRIHEWVKMREFKDLKAQIDRIEQFTTEYDKQ